MSCDAASDTARFGDRQSDQMDPANAAEALRETQADTNQGADIVIITYYAREAARASKKSSGFRPTTRGTIAGRFSDRDDTHCVTPK
jgi:hypothetical protein